MIERFEVLMEMGIGDNVRGIGREKKKNIKPVLYFLLPLLTDRLLVLR